MGWGGGSKTYRGKGGRKLLSLCVREGCVFFGMEMSFFFVVSRWPKSPF